MPVVAFHRSVKIKWWITGRKFRPLKLCSCGPCLKLCLYITDDLRKIFKDYDTKFIITIPALVPKVLAAKADLDNIQVLIHVFLALWYINTVDGVIRFGRAMLLNSSYNKNELRHVKTNKIAVRPATTQLSLGIRQVCPESSLSA